MRAQALLRQAGRLLARLLVVVFLFIEVYPLFWLVSSAFKTTSEFSLNSMFALPQSFYIDNFIYAWTVGNVGILFKNTMFVTVFSLAAVLLLSSMCAFAISRMRWKLCEPIFIVFKLGMFIPAFVLLLPQFLLFKDIGVLNTGWALIIAFGCNISMATFLLVGFYNYIPNELFEASIIDGCSIYRCFFHIAVPLTSNGYITVLMVTFFGIWNNLLVSQTFVSSATQKTLQAGLASYLDSQIGRDWGATFASVSIAVIPTVLIYLLLSKYVIIGVTEGSVKG